MDTIIIDSIIEYINTTNLEERQQNDAKFIAFVKNRDIEELAIAKKSLSIYFNMYVYALEATDEQVMGMCYDYLFAVLSVLTPKDKITIAKRNPVLFALLNFDMQAFLEKQTSLAELEFLYYPELTFDENTLLYNKVVSLYDNKARPFALDSPYLKTWLFLAENGHPLKVKIDKIKHRKMTDDLILYNLSLLWRYCYISHFTTIQTYQLYEAYIMSFIQDRDWTNEIVAHMFNFIFAQVPRLDDMKITRIVEGWVELFVKYYELGDWSWDKPVGFQDVNSVMTYFQTNTDEHKFSTWKNIINYFATNDLATEQTQMLLTEYDRLVESFAATPNLVSLTSLSQDQSDTAIIYNAVAVLENVLRRERDDKTARTPIELFIIDYIVYYGDNPTGMIHKIGLSLLIGIDVTKLAFEESEAGRRRFLNWALFLYISMLSLSV